MSEKTALAKLMRSAHGNLSEIARRLAEKGTPITRQEVTRRLQKYGLAEEAERLRVQSAVSGPRASLTDGVVDRDTARRAAITALATSAGYRAAAEKLGISPRTMARRMRLLEITQEEVEAARSASRRAN